MGLLSWVFGGGGGPPDWVPKGKRNARGAWLLVRTPGYHWRAMRPRAAWAAVRKSIASGREDWSVRELYDADSGKHERNPPYPDGLRTLRIQVWQKAEAKSRAKEARRQKAEARRQKAEEKREIGRRKADTERQIHTQIDHSYRRGYL